MSDPTPAPDAPAPDAPATPAAPPPTAAPTRPAGCLGALRHWALVLFPALSFLAGFVWDALTMGRIDSWKDDLFLAVYLAGLGGLLALEMRLDAGAIRRPFLVRHAPWVSWFAQFLFGGLYSAYIVFYFRSAFSWVSFLFLVGLFVLAVVTEFREHTVRSPRLRSALYWLAAYNFLLFMIPVLTGWFGAGLGVLAALFATSAAAAVVVVGSGSRAALARHAPGWGVVAAVLLVADLLGVIPPVPMALMDVGVFHHVEGTPRGYALTYEKPPWYRPFTDDDRRFHARDGDRIWTFTRVFGPTGLSVGLTYAYDRWTREDGWVEVSRSSMSIKGGRERGFRSFSYTRQVKPGPWRVRVLLENGRELGRYRFTVDEAAPDHAFVPETRYDR